ncbi:putative 2OG-Fe oxygenase superfamily protein [Rosellinia necatrix]|uniref:Putative 2OG-Fe oxygenase superfamily protein n=1 Tax=Rosellinia necatrix TaxID=77044 RepID=A0A1W2TWP8_ROSNE|nr:putative 2OG-Fe oxygenase superfamily protein [Rosellinia necatrix]
MPGLTVEAIPATPPKAPKVIGPKVKKATRPTTAIPEYLIEEARNVPVIQWNAEQHLTCKVKPNVTTMKELGLEGHGISPVAVSDPFPMFSKEAMMQMRREIFSQPVLENCRYSSDFIANMVRGMGWERAPFTYAAWNSPEFLAKVSEVAGVELVPAYDFEVANVNISINDQEAAVVTYGDKASAVAWHYDSFPFVCVTMASDCTNMIGGETAIQLPNGDIKKVRGPDMGTAVIMQGRYCYHQALKAFGGRERIAIVTAFRPKDPLARDETILTGVRGISNLEELYPQYTFYRLENLEERFRLKIKEERRREVERRPFDIAKTRAFLLEQKEYLESMLEELIEVN